MKSKIGEIDGRPLVVSSQPDEIKGPELLVTFNEDVDKITDIQKREGENLMSVLDIKEDPGEGSLPDILITYNIGTGYYYDPDLVNADTDVYVYYMLDNSYFIPYSGPIQYNPEDPAIELTHVRDISITVLNPSKNTEARVYINKLRDRMAQKLQPLPYRGSCHAVFKEGPCLNARLLDHAGNSLHINSEWLSIKND